MLNTLLKGCVELRVTNATNTVRVADMRQVAVRNLAELTMHNWLKSSEGFVLPTHAILLATC